MAQIFMGIDNKKTTYDNKTLQLIIEEIQSLCSWVALTFNKIWLHEQKKTKIITNKYQKIILF